MTTDPHNTAKKTSPPTLDYGHTPPRIPKWVVRTIEAVALLILLAIAVRWILGQIYRPIPIQMISYNIGDFGVFGGELTVITRLNGADEFRITFEGKDNGHAGGGSSWIVDGREVGPMPWNFKYFESTLSEKSGLTAKSSSKTHTVLIDYSGKHFVYDYATRTLTVDGVSYPTAARPAYLRIGLDGHVKPQTGPLY